MSALALADVTCCIGGRTVLDHIDCTFEGGTATAVVGPTGAGKSTLGRVVSGEVALRSGRVLRGEGPDHVVRLGQRWVAPWTTVAEALAGPDHLGRNGRTALLARLDLENLDPSTPVAELPPGEARRLVVASSLLGDPSVVVLDEPTSGTDPQTDAALVELVGWLTARGRTVIVITNDARFARAAAPSAVVLDGGRVTAVVPSTDVDFLAIQTRNMEALRAAPGSPAGAQPWSGRGCPSPSSG